MYLTIRLPMGAFPLRVDAESSQEGWTWRVVDELSADTEVVLGPVTALFSQYGLLRRSSGVRNGHSIEDQACRGL